MINKNFIYNIINKDIKNNKYKKIITRFAPEPNGILHIGHLKSIYLNFNIAKHYKGKCYLRFDDTNPEKEKKKYINIIKKNIKWLGYKWNGRTKYSSNYFNIYYKFAKLLIKKNLAYIDEQDILEIKFKKGSFTKLGINSPYRNRSIKNNLKLFKKMKEGFYKEKVICLRAKINMYSKNILLRDPIIYRIKYKKHPKTLYKWCIYPTYDFAHCIADSIEKISHSICTLEFQNNNPLYQWILKNIEAKHIPKQYEFSKLNILYNITSKSKINLLIKYNIIKKWNDPRLLTITGLKKRGYDQLTLINFCKNLGISKQESYININILENLLSKNFNKTLKRRFAIINPIKIKLINLKKKKKFKILNNPVNINSSYRKIKLYSKIFIDKKDININNIKSNINKKFKLRYAGIIKIIKIKINCKKKIKYIICKYYNINKIIKNKFKIIHWISQKKSIKSYFRFFNKLFTKKYPNKYKNLLSIINNKSIIIKKGYIEKSILKIKKEKIQFERLGYFKYNKNLSKKYILFDRIIKLKN